jgi:hypothetical protein
MMPAVFLLARGVESLQAAAPEVLTPSLGFAIPVRTENVVGRPDSAAKALVGAGGFSLADAESLIAFHRGW